MMKSWALGISLPSLYGLVANEVSDFSGALQSCPPSGLLAMIFYAPYDMCGARFLWFSGLMSKQIKI